MARKSVLEELEIALGKMRRIVDEKGAYVLAVPEDKDAGTPDYVHTVGLTERELPELVLFGVPLWIGELVLESLIVRLLAGEPLPRDERLTAGPFTVVLNDVPKEVALSYIGVVHALYDEHEISCVQVVLADIHGRFPWEDGFKDLTLQPVLSRQ